MMRKKLPADRAMGAQKSMEKPQWRATALALATAVLLGFRRRTPCALALGRVTVQSALGEPLRADIDIPEINAEELASLRAAVASPDAFRAAGLEYSPALSGSRSPLQRRPDGRHFLRLSSHAPRQRAVRRPDPGGQLVVRPHRARLHDAVRPAEPAPERAAPAPHRFRHRASQRRSRPPPPPARAPAAPRAPLPAAQPRHPARRSRRGQPPSGDGKQVTVQSRRHRRQDRGGQQAGQRLARPDAGGPAARHRATLTEVPSSGTASTSLS